MFVAKHILVPVDTDPSADAQLADLVVDAAGDLASFFKARVTLVHVAVPIVVPVLDASDKQRHKLLLDATASRNDVAERSLVALEQRLRAGGVTAEHTTIDGANNVADAVIELVAAKGVDLITLATGGRTDAQTRILGNVAERIAHLSPVPVLLIPARKDS